MASGVNCTEGNASISSYEWSDLSQVIRFLCSRFLSYELVAETVLKSCVVVDVNDIVQKALRSVPGTLYVFS